MTTISLGAAKIVVNSCFNKTLHCSNYARNGKIFCLRATNFYLLLTTMDQNSIRAETPLVANAVAAVRELISMPAYSHGGRLPSEAELADRIGVSRPVLRQALAVLKNEGTITARRGSGTYARPSGPAIHPYGKPESLADLADCMRFRMVIESAAAGLAARQAEDAALREIRETIAAMESGQSQDKMVLDIDMAFHLAVARATRSRYYAMTLEFLMPHIMFGLKLARELRHIPPHTTSQRVAAEHRAILSAIESRNQTMAADCMRDHLSSGIERIFGNRGW
jgi:DNA-binding FadR family transcriptional regulator